MNSPHLTHKILSTADLAIIGLYFCVVFAIGFYSSRKERTTADYFLGSRKVGWFAIGASLFISNAKRFLTKNNIDLRLFDLTREEFLRQLT